MRTLAASIAQAAPDVLAVFEIEPGDALALATRFALQWAYRGHQALFWSAAFRAARVRDMYLPAVGALPFERRGFISVEAEYRGRPCVLAATQFSDERRARIAELRFVRGHLRAAAGDAIFCAHLRETRIAVGDLGFRDAVEPPAGAEHVYVRGMNGVQFAIRTASL